MTMHALGDKKQPVWRVEVVGPDSDWYYEVKAHGAPGQGIVESTLCVDRNQAEALRCRYYATTAERDPGIGWQGRHVYLGERWSKEDHERAFGPRRG